ncbi:MAG: biotin--[acetyl-CoA-carboxylase] ligase [Salinibacter sp.]|uniref:biotin--[acetyl-CoA-carboxylase] ligase n=1 Tax=Salinibacter sp. TaxID=2065818 RepID=UPI0035D45848
MSLSLTDDVQARLATDRFGHKMRGFETVGSTNTEAAEWAKNGAAEGSVVVTEYQSDGRGRHGRTWNARKGQNLMFSVVLRPTLGADRLGLITVAASVAVAEAVDDFVSPYRAVLKWPNDVLLEGRKTCGMLLESSISGADAADVVVLGVGLNVNQTDFPEALADTATSLRLTTGRPVPRAPLLSRLLERLEAQYGTIQSGDDASVRSAFHDRLPILHEHATFRVPGTDRTISGTVQGITETGALRLHTPDGPQTVQAGNVTSQHSP